MPSLLTFPIRAELLVPHRPPMLFVDYLLERSGGKARGLAVLPDSGACCASGQLLPEIFIELIAQTSAMANGYDRLAENRRMTDGMLVGVDSFFIYSLGRPGQQLIIEADKTFEFGPVTLISGKVRAGDVLLAEGTIKVWENPGGSVAE